MAKVLCTVHECEHQKGDECSLDQVLICPDGFGDSDCASFNSRTRKSQRDPVIPGNS